MDRQEKDDFDLASDVMPDILSDTTDVMQGLTAGQNRARVRAIRILGSRQMSSQAMEKRLLEKGESDEEARDTVRWLEDIGAVNDSDYARAIVSHYSTKGYGPARIRNELFRRGIPRELWEEAATGLDDADNDEAVYRFLEKKLRGLGSGGDLSDTLTWKNELRRATDALCRRGFSYEDARCAINNYLESIGNTDEIEE